MPAVKQITLKPNTLYSGDCLGIMQHWNAGKHAGSVDLIYLDPPFNSNTNYNIIFNKEEDTQFTAFKDTWRYDKAHDRVQAIIADTQHPAHKSILGFNAIIPDSPTLSYLSYMAERLVEMHELLKDTGSLYLHCDATASHYLKIILDDIFGKENFRNEIVWHYFKPSSTKKNYPKNYDNIFFYSKSNAWTFNYDACIVGYDEKSIKRYDKTDADGRKYKLYNEKDGTVRKAYLNKGKGENVFAIPFLQGTSKERIGYPTQKPIALLKRIVAASSNPGDLVLDPFCGCGTTAHAAFELQRNFLGIDISVYALDKICKARLKEVDDLEIKGLPTDFATAEKMNPFEFEQWSVTLMQGFYPNNKQTGDGGVDGRATLLHKPEGESGLVIAQVKMGSPSADAQRALVSQIVGGKASMGVFVTLHKVSDTKTKLEAIKNAGSYQLSGGEIKHPRLIYWSIEEHFKGIKPPLPEMVPTREERQLDMLIK